MPQCKCTFNGLWGTKNRRSDLLVLFDLKHYQYIAKSKRKLRCSFQVACLIVHGRLLKQGVDFYSCYFIKFSKSNEKNSACRSDGSFQCTCALLGSKEKSPWLVAVSESVNAERQLQFCLLLCEELGEDTYIKYSKMIQALF